MMLMMKHRNLVGLSYLRKVYNMNGELFEGIEKPPEGLSKEELKAWMREHRDYPEMTLEEYMMLPTREEYHEIIYSIPRGHEPGDKYRLGEDPEVGDIAVFMEFMEIKNEVRKSELPPAMDPIDVHGNVPLTTITLQMRLCWIT
jgi:hypothetical protein